jgi:carbon starvation protein
MPIFATLVCFFVYWLGYRFYASYLARQVFALEDDVPTPAHVYRDDVDFVPTPRWILFGHHYASITGLSPMLGPAIAVIWGWLPAMVWVVLGALLIGCVHDFAALVLSLRARGLSVGALAEGIVGARAKTMFHVIIFFGIGLAMGVFVSVISTLFLPTSYPQAVMPSFLLMAVAMVVGATVFRTGAAPLVPVLLAFGVTLVSVAIAAGSDALTVKWADRDGWAILLLAYSYAASVLPVWLLLQPRDSINSLLLYLGVGLMYLGFFVLGPSFAAPAVVLHPEGAPSLFPFVFVVIACGAVSGFHGLVSSGTTSKQIDRSSDAPMIGYGGMIGESLLGLMAVLACTAGFQSPETWQQHYSSWASAASLGSKVSIFIDGSANFVAALGIPLEFASALIAVVVVSFALTTLDSATRLLRYNLAEMGATLGLKNENRFVTSALAIGVIAFFAFYRVDGKSAGIALWGLFGTTNQLLASLTLLIASVYLLRRGRNWLVTGVPAIFMTSITLFAMISNLLKFWQEGQTALFVVGLILLLLAVGFVFEGTRAFFAARRMPVVEDLNVFLEAIEPR